ncbi:MAG: hypothetical protein L6R39_000189 [Caloplaca ligustica]|nr:MAG: hypothetical protein L6R39_000189 [Caloplaca ligustica]
MDPTYPPSDSSNVLDYTPEGCYTEGYNGRAVAFRQDQLSSTNLTTEACLGACKSQNFPLAATEYGGECYCGVQHFNYFYLFNLNNQRHVERNVDRLLYIHNQYRYSIRQHFDYFLHLNDQRSIEYNVDRLFYIYN